MHAPMPTHVPGSELGFRPSPKDFLENNYLLAFVAAASEGSSSRWPSPVAASALITKSGHKQNRRHRQRGCNLFLLHLSDPSMHLFALRLRVVCCFHGLLGLFYSTRMQHYFTSNVC